MRLENSFSVRAPIDEVWAALLDVERVAPCVPGARVVERQSDDVFRVEFEVGLGGDTVAYRGQVAILERETSERRAVLSITASEAAGGGTADARLVLTVAERGELTDGTLSAEVSVSGEAAAAGDEAIHDVSVRVIDGFSRNLAALLGGGIPTVNGADPASSTPRTPAAAGETPPATRPMLVGAATAAIAAEADAVPGGGQPAGSESLPEPPPAAPPISEGSWAGATRQAGATIERLRSPLGVTTLFLVLLGVILVRRGRGGDADQQAAAPPASAD